MFAHYFMVINFPWISLNFINLCSLLTAHSKSLSNFSIYMCLLLNNVFYFFKIGIGLHLFDFPQLHQKDIYVVHYMFCIIGCFFKKIIPFNCLSYSLFQLIMLYFPLIVTHLFCSFFHFLYEPSFE